MAKRENESDPSLPGDGPLMKRNKEQKPYWELNKKKRVTVSKFKNTVLVDIREYYEKDGEMLPGNKGVALTMDAWEALKKILPEIDAQLQAESGR